MGSKQDQPNLVKVKPVGQDQNETKKALINNANEDELKEKIQKIDKRMQKSAMKTSFQKMKEDPTVN